MLLYKVNQCHDMCFRATFVQIKAAWYKDVTLTLCGPTSSNCYMTTTESSAASTTASNVQAYVVTTNDKTGTETITTNSLSNTTLQQNVNSNTDAGSASC